ncbi:MAG: EF-hand domain-containing protein [Pelagimonas sp.]|uniref:EF-hand domain-containing protein n=1 Tax=Pelagimonas sp. TaxID=2073170 RepID=UPI003D6B522A
MKNTTILGGVLILALGAGSLASAAGMNPGKGMRGGMDAEQMFELLDTDKDGQITKEEAQNAGKARFATVDTDGDGFLSAEELTAAAEKRDAERQKKRGERIATMMEKLDTDKDGKLSAEEMDARRGMGKKGKGRGGDRAMKMFDRADANDDGVLTMEEIEQAQAKMGKRMGRHGKGRGHY